MDSVTRRTALGIGAASGAALLTGAAPATAKDEKPRSSPVDSATVTVKNVIIDEFDPAGGTISVRFGKKEKATKLVRVPLAEEVRVVASHIYPGVANNLPFEWEQLKWVRGKVVSVRLHVAAAGLSVVSIAAGND